jgi:hypothetical protein
VDNYPLDIKAVPDDSPQMKADAGLFESAFIGG